MSMLYGVKTIRP
jgi:hypothetical protein